MSLLWHQMKMKILSKSVIARRITVLWLDDVAISSTHFVILRSVLCDVRIPSDAIAVILRIRNQNP